MFVIFINDLPDVIHVMMRMYADDSKILRSLKTPDHVNQVQASVNQSVICVSIWQKCHHLHIGNNMEDTAYTMEITNGRVPIEKVQSGEDLDVSFDSKLNFTKHISSKVKKANQIVGLIFKTFTFMDIEMFLNLFKSFVRPHLEYATTIWAPI